MAEHAKEIMTFRTGASLFGVPIQNVLSILGESDKLFCKAFKSKEALGVIEYRGTPVSVIDLAIAGNITSDSILKSELIDLLQAREQDHIAWLAALEKAIVENAPFTLSKDPKTCEFGRWYDTFETQDQDLQEIVLEFQDPHIKIHAIADTLLTLTAQGEKEKALELLQVERETTFVKLRSLFARAIGQLKGSIKPVFIYLTMDGVTPCAAMRVDEIADVHAVSENAFVPMKDMALPQVNNMDYIKGFVKMGEKGDCLLIDVETLTNHRALQIPQQKSA